MLMMSGNANKGQKLSNLQGIQVKLPVSLRQLEQPLSQHTRVLASRP